MQRWRAAEVTVLQQQLKDMEDSIKKGAVPPSSLNMENLSPEMREQMKALGYVGDEEEETPAAEPNPTQD